MLGFFLCCMCSFKLILLPLFQNLDPCLLKILNARLICNVYKSIINQASILQDSFPELYGLPCLIADGEMLSREKKLGIYYRMSIVISMQILLRYLFKKMIECWLIEFILITIITLKNKIIKLLMLNLLIFILNNVFCGTSTSFTTFCIFVTKDV